MPDRAARRVLEAWTDRLQPAAQAYAQAQWAMATAATPENREAVEAAALQMEELSHDEVGLARVEQSLHERIDDPVLRRALERLRLRLLPHRVARPEVLIRLEAEVQERFAQERAEVGDDRLDANAVRDVLRSSTDSARVEATWRGAVAIGTTVADQVRAMARLRNEHARETGYADFRALQLDIEEVVPAQLDRFLDDLEAGTNELWNARKEALDQERAARFGVAPEELGPWHFGDVFLHAIPRAGERDDPLRDMDPLDLARRTFRGIGHDVEDVLDASDLVPREGKNQHAFCIHIDKEGDVRVLANIVPSERWTRTMLHELGHAIYEKGLDQELPWILRRPPHSSTTEGVAMLFGRLVEDPDWRARVARLAPDDTAVPRWREDLLTFVRWGLVMCRFEEALYADPEQDLDQLWWGLVERLQGVRRPDPLPEGVWAAKIHVACWPAYYHAYLLGEATASLLSRHIKKNVFGRRLVENPTAGTYLVDRVFRPSATMRWERLVEEATHGRLEAGALLADLQES